MEQTETTAKLDFPTDVCSTDYLYISTNLANFAAIKKQGILSTYFVKNYEELLNQATDLYWKYFEKNNQKKTMRVLYLRKKIQDNNTIEFFRFNKWVNITSPWIDKNGRYKILEKITIPEAILRISDNRIKSKRFATIMQLQDHCVNCNMKTSYAALGKDAGGHLHWDLYSEQKTIYFQGLWEARITYQTIKLCAGFAISRKEIKSNNCVTIWPKLLIFTINKEIDKNMQNLACLMTLSQYQEQVTPLFKEYNKFFKKNESFFKKADYTGIYLMTFSQYMDREKNGSYYSEKYAIERWTRDYQKTQEDPSEEIVKQYNSLLEKFKQFFTDVDLKKIEKDEVKSNKRSIRRGIDSNFYIDALKDGLVTPSRLEEIFASVGVNIPTNIQKMKYKVEVEGYDRSTELAQAKKTKEFEDSLRKELKPYYDSLKDREKRRLMLLIENFEELYQADISNIKNSGSRSGNREEYNRYKAEVETYNQVTDFFTSKYDKHTDHSKVWKAERISSFDQHLEDRITRYAENFIVTLVQRLELKLRVINTKLGQPVLSVVSHGSNAGNFEGIIKAVWSNGIEIFIEAEVIIAGGMVQTDHYRYLLKPFYNKKYIDLENIDSLNFK